MTRLANPNREGNATIATQLYEISSYHMPKTIVALTIDTTLLQRLDELVEGRRFRNRSQAIEAALADNLERLARTRLAATTPC